MSKKFHLSEDLGKKETTGRESQDAGPLITADSSWELSAKK